MTAAPTERGVRLSDSSVEKLAAAIVAGMIIEAAYHGEETTASEISATIVADPNGATADYFLTAVAGSLDWIAKFQADPELLTLFPGGEA